MAEHTRYTLDIPPLPAGADAVEQFLFEDRRGFCEQIGTSLVVLLRSLGIPARLGVGYVSGERNPFTGLYEVRASDAHAWAEVWFPGVGWQIFDPTASVPLAGDSGLAGAGSGLGAFLSARLPDLPDAVPARLGVGYAAGERNPFTGLYEVRASDAHAWAEVWFPGVGWQIFDPTASVPLAGESALAGAGAGLASFLSARLPDLSDAVPLLLALAAIAGAGAGLRSLLRRRRGRRAARARSWAEAWSVELESLGATVGRPRRPHESLREYVTALRPVLPARGWSQAVAVVEEDAFSGTPAPPERRATAERVLVEARRSDG